MDTAKRPHGHGQMLLPLESEYNLQLEYAEGTMNAGRAHGQWVYRYRENSCNFRQSWLTRRFDDGASMWNSEKVRVSAPAPGCAPEGRRAPPPSPSRRPCSP